MWTTEKELKQQALKLWEKGIFLTALVRQENLFPLKLKLNKPTSAQITTHFEQVRQWVARLSQIEILRIEWKEVNHRVQGSQRLPEAIYLDSIDSLLKWLRKNEIYQQFRQLKQLTEQQEPLLLEWLAKYPFRALAQAENWQSLLNVVAWRKANSQPKMYLRQVDIPQVHSKFIEQHRSLLSEWFENVLPETEINADYPASQFALRYGFLEKPKQIRFRNLDCKRSIFPGILQSDLSLDVESFAQLNPPISRVIIVENEINYLTLPTIENAWAIFGAGYGWSYFKSISWLANCEIYYWGDIDTHGFAILNYLRYYLPQTISFLMDEQTLLKNRLCWSVESKPQKSILERLTPAEQQLYQALQNHKYGQNVRLEQELIPFSDVKQTLIQLFS